MTKRPKPQHDDPPPAADAAAPLKAGENADADALKNKSLAELARMGRSLYETGPQPAPQGEDALQGTRKRRRPGEDA